MYERIQRETMRSAPQIYLFERFGNAAYHKSLVDMRVNPTSPLYATATKE